MAGRHRRVQNSVALGAVRPMVGAVPLVLAVACAGTATADPVATPTTPGVSQPEQSIRPAGVPQPGTTAPAEAPQPGTGSRVEQAVDVPVVEGDTDPGIQRAAPAPAPQRGGPQSTVPADVLPDPVVVPEADLPTHELRIGDFRAPVPREVPADLLLSVNNGLSGLAGAPQGAGVDADRSGKIATGALVGAAAAGVPGAMVGGVGGGLIGAGLGFGAGVVGTAAVGAVAAAAAGASTCGPGALPVAGVAMAAAVPITAVTTVAGAAVGAAVGAAAVGIPAAAVGAAVGGGVGAVI